MENKNIIKEIAETLIKNKEVTETDVRKALITHKIFSPETMADLMDAVEVYGVEIKTDGYRIEDEDEDEAGLNPIRLYFDDISKYKLLSAEEEKKLLELAKNGNKVAEEKLLASNLRLVVSIAKRYTYKAELLDLISSGNIGLLNAIRNFDMGKGVRLSTYATWWIKQSIVRMIANTGATIRLPVYANEIVRNMSAYITDFQFKNGREPSTKEIAKKFNITETTAESIMLTMAGCKSLDTPVANDESGLTTQGDLLADNTVDVEGDVLAQCRREEILEVLSNVLTEKEANVVCMRNGLVDDGEQHTLEEIGNSFGVSRERIRQIEKKAMLKLRSSEEVFERLYPWLVA